MRAARRPAGCLAAALLLSSAVIAVAPAGAADNGDLIVFSRGGDLWTMPASRSGDADEVATNITNTDDVFEDSPSWASETVIRYVQATERVRDGGIWQVDVDGTDRKPISPDVLVDDLAWSSDGRFTYTRDVPTNPRKNQFQQDVFVASKLDLSDEVNVSDHPAHDGNPAISADGTKVAFDTTREGSSSSVWVADLTASPFSVARVATSDPQDGGRFPAWSPDGSALVYMEYVNPTVNWGLRIVEGGSERRLTTGGGNEWDAEFSPDGTQVVFSHWDGSPKNKFHIRRVVVADSLYQPAQSTALTTGDGSVSRYPSWQPKAIDGGSDEDCPLGLPIC